MEEGVSLPKGLELEGYNRLAPHGIGLDPSGEGARNLETNGYRHQSRVSKRYPESRERTRPKSSQRCWRYQKGDILCSASS